MTSSHANTDWEQDLLGAARALEADLVDPVTGNCDLCVSSNVYGHHKQDCSLASLRDIINAHLFGPKAMPPEATTHYSYDAATNYIHKFVGGIHACNDERCDW